MFSIKAIAQTVIVSGKIAETKKFLIVDENDEAVLVKFFDTEEAAQAEIDALGTYAEGLAFAKSFYPGQAEKALKGKAIVVQNYLDWIKGGRVDNPAPDTTKKADTSTATESAGEAAPEPESAVKADEAF